MGSGRERGPVRLARGLTSHRADDPTSPALRTLGWAAWGVMAVGALVTLAERSLLASPPVAIYAVALPAFFIVLVARLLAAAARWPHRRPALWALLIGLLSWAAGAAVVAGAETSTAVFPAPGEFFFLGAYVAFALYLIIDVQARSRPSPAAWLEAAVVCGGAVGLASALIVTPWALQSQATGLALLLATLYPLIDVVLLAVVIGQMFLRTRPISRYAVGLCLGFFAFAIADLTLVLNVEAHTYQWSAALDLVWATGCALIVAAACAPDWTRVAGDARPAPILLLVAASGVALVVLLIHPNNALGWYLTVPAVITLISAGGRLVLAIREARKAAEAYRLARTDDLTDLPNRRAVLARLDTAFAQDEAIGVLLLDLDGFKEINDTLGHHAGDELLRIVGQRIREAVPAEVDVARLGGDEFAVVDGNDLSADLLELARDILAALRRPTRIEGLDVVVTASIGIACRDGLESSNSDLLRRADVAMYQAKLSGSGAVIYDPANDEFSRHRWELTEELRRGLAAGEVVLWYQPQVDVVTSRVVGVEALVRWEHPEQGVLAPAVFLPLARRSGLMGLLSENVVRMAVAHASRWRADGMDLRVSINLAPPELLGGLIIPQLFDAVAKAGLPPDAIVVEVTEDSFLADPDLARRVLDDVRAHGIQASVDDYGTGFSSLAYLRDLPMSELKMDRSFVSSIRADHRSGLIVKSTAQLAGALGLRLVAEGVEDAATAAALAEMGIDVLQGYHISPPIPAENVAGWVSEWQRHGGSRTAAAGRGLDPAPAGAWLRAAAGAGRGPGAGELDARLGGPWPAGPLPGPEPWAQTPSRTERARPIRSGRRQGPRGG